MRTTTPAVFSVLFSDVQGFSKIGDDRLSGIVKEHIAQFLSGNLNERNHFYKNTWGDGILICSFDPHDLLEIALKLNDSFLNKNWKREGFENQLLLRIGLHIDKATIVKEDDQIIDVDGKNINKAARIEPIVEPGRIYCSEMFMKLAEGESIDFVQFMDLGNKELAKQFGVLHLFEVLKPGSTKTTPLKVAENTIAGIKIRKNYSDLEKEEYLQKCFDNINQYFKAIVVELEMSDSDIKAIIEDTEKNKFICQVFVRGEKRAECQIWIGTEFARGICYYEGINNRYNSYNEIFSVQSDGFKLFLSSFSMGLIGIGPMTVTIDNVAKLLWDRFVKVLGR